MHHFVKTIVLAGSILLSLSACNKEEIIAMEDYPRMYINEEISQDDASVIFEAGFLTQTGEVLDKGFVWGSGVFPVIENSSHISLGNGYGTDSFSAAATFDVIEGNQYEVHAYAITAEKVIYSKAVSFTSETNGVEFTLEDFSLLSGSIKDTLVIRGSNLSYHEERTKVFFNQDAASILQCSDSTIVVTVPDMLTLKKVAIRVRIGTLEKTFEEFLTLI